MFFALKGDNFDGNHFAQQAIEQGASYAVIDDASLAPNPSFILVEDGLAALQQLARYHRRRLNTPIIGITGSNGKTTTKELIHAVLAKKYHTQYTQGNLNNHIGVPLTLLSITTKHQMAVVEMGANHQKEIDFLCRIAEPNFGIITNIGKAHLEGFGGIEGVKKGKGEMYQYLQETHGIVFLHGDDDTLAELAQKNKKITYGTRKLYDIVGLCDTNSLFVAFAWRTRYTASEIKKAPFIQTHLVGLYNYHNALCAACVGAYFKIENNLIDEAIAQYEPTNNRSQLKKTTHNSLILDYYNANPSSMQAAIENFSAMNAQHKMLILGDMLELGETSVQEHQQVVSLLHQKKLHDYILVGPIFSEIEKEKSFLNAKEAASFLQQQEIKNKTILIKGSRGIALEQVLHTL